MLQIVSGAKRFGPKLLFERIDLQINPQERTALVGGNGSGKSTLMRILAGLDLLDEGVLERSGGLTVGYLPQDGLQMQGRTVFEEAASVFAATRQLEETIGQLHHRIADLSPESDEYRSVSEELARTEAQFQTADGYTIDARVGTVLAGLGFSASDWNRSTEEFSGGWQMRIALGKLLLQQPSLLLLDEPTNHLDLEARNWLEEYLRTYPNAYLLISHDRYFLDVTTHRTLELWNRQLHSYRGNYEQYLRQKTERRAQLEAAARAQREQIERLEAFINRFRAQATKAKQVQSRIKELERIERIELPPEEPVIHFEFPQPPPSGRIALEARNISKSYGKNLVFSGAAFTIERGERIALIGPNGAGKSTLLRLLAGLEAPDTGHIQLGHNVNLQYFAQDQYKTLDADARMLEDLERIAPRVPTVELRNLLGCFLFHGDDVFKPLGVLSGGERNRYALARMLVSPANLLLLDEPTNHLDMRAKEVLLEAIRNFSGTVIFVSHDRAFLDAVSTRTFELREKELRIFAGNYEDFLRQSSELSPPPGQNEMERRDTPSPSLREIPLAPAEETAKPRRMNPIRLRQMQERCATLEEEIPRLEAAMRTVEEEMAVYVSQKHTEDLIAQSQRLREEHAALLAEWEDLMLQLEGQPALL
jgi:ATP-binding cassette subfamily F protein 3